MTAATQPRAKTIARLEEATDALLYEAERCKEAAPTEWERRQRRLALFRAAREYGHAMDALARGPRG